MHAVDITQCWCESRWYSLHDAANDEVQAILLDSYNTFAQLYRVSLLLIYLADM